LNFNRAKLSMYIKRGIVPQADITISGTKSWERLTCERYENDDDDRYDDREQTVQSNNFISKQQAIEIAEEAVNGTVTEVELDEDDNQYVYELELKTSQSEAEVEVDAVTGKVLDKEYDDNDNDDDLDD